MAIQHNKVPLFLEFNPFLDARAEIRDFFFLVFEGTTISF